MTHWQSPHFHAYYPAANSYPSMVADILSDAINCVGFSWVNIYMNFFSYLEDKCGCCQIASPACTELEVVVMDWLAKILDLPEMFMSGGKGGGVIQVRKRH